MGEGIYIVVLLVRRLVLLVLCVSSPAFASTWIEGDDWRSRQDVLQLADIGVISSVVTAFPLPCDALNDDLNAAKEQALSASQGAAVARLVAQCGLESSLELFASTASSRGLAKTETDSMRGRGEAGVRIAGHSESGSAVLRMSAVMGAPEAEDSYAFDGSYGVYQLGNWLFGAGHIAQKFGPGLDTQLVRSTNARTMPTFYVSRNSSEPVDFPVLNWLGSWTFINSVSWMDDDRLIDGALLWTMRAAIRPVSFFEFGISKAAQLCGEGKTCSASSWRRTLTGDTNVWSGENPANQIASMDFRFSGVIGGVPAALYWETMGEDAFSLSDFPPFQAKSNLVGLSLDVDQHRVFVEASETGAWCTGSRNCTYEHGTYRSGYRYQSRTLGSSYDNDTKAYVLGYRGSLDFETYFTLHARFLDLNFDNSNAAAPGGNPVSAERLRIRQLEGGYGFSLRNGSIDLGEARIGLELSFIDETAGQRFGSYEHQFWVEWEKAF